MIEWAQLSDLIRTKINERAPEAVTVNSDIARSFKNWLRSHVPPPPPEPPAPEGWDPKRATGSMVDPSSAVEALQEAQASPEAPSGTPPEQAG